MSMVNRTESGGNLVCPSCGSATRVTDTRPIQEGQGIRRRRACLACQKRITTYETAASEAAVFKPSVEAMLSRLKKVADELSQIEHQAQAILTVASLPNAPRGGRKTP